MLCCLCCIATIFFYLFHPLALRHISDPHPKRCRRHNRTVGNAKGYCFFPRQKLHTACSGYAQPLPPPSQRLGRLPALLITKKGKRRERERERERGGGGGERRDRSSCSVLQACSVYACSHHIQRWALPVFLNIFTN